MNLMRKKMEWNDFFNSMFSILYLYIAWLSGIVLGYMIRIRDEGDL